MELQHQLKGTALRHCLRQGIFVNCTRLQNILHIALSVHEFNKQFVAYRYPVEHVMPLLILLRIQCHPNNSPKNSHTSSVPTSSNLDGRSSLNNDQTLTMHISQLSKRFILFISLSASITAAQMVYQTPTVGAASRCRGLKLNFLTKASSLRHSVE